jgi:nucleoside-diphosphate-sugar epimerase
MRIFLTGATGNVGNQTVKMLVNEGHDVVCLVRKNIKIDSCKIVKGDLKKINRKIANEISDTDGIIHLASPRSFNREIVVLEDILGTASIIDNWEKGNFVYMSSQVVYGIPDGILTESSPIKPFCWYDIGKICNEYQLNVSGNNRSRKAAISLRMALLFGNGPRCKDRQFLYDVFRNCINNSTFIFRSEEGLETYGSSFLGERDCASFICKSLELEQSGGYNIASGFCTWKELIELICKKLNKKPNYKIKAECFAEKGECRMPQSISLMDISKFYKLTRFKPFQTLEELIEQYNEYVKF